MAYLGTATELPGVMLLTPQVFEDARGFLFESFNEREFARVTGSAPRFVQDNHSASVRGVLRGLHYQIVRPQGKLVRVVRGEIFDVAVDVRRDSPTFGAWTGARLSAENKQQLWVPEGFAHGFLTLSDVAEVLYKTTDFWHPEHERTIRWDDRTIGIEWPLEGPPRLGPKDAAAPALVDADLF
jgi:dTDP-4-dehydrorhamnose 3,5-epimerase